MLVVVVILVGLLSGGKDWEDDGRAMVAVVSDAEDDDDDADDDIICDLSSSCCCGGWSFSCDRMALHSTVRDEKEAVRSVMEVAAAPKTSWLVSFPARPFPRGNGRAIVASSSLTRSDDGCASFMLTKQRATRRYPEGSSHSRCSDL